MTTQHTPGPWHHKEGSVSVFAPDKPRRKICDTAWQTINVTEARANARLIAAAPDLLEALKRTVSRLESHTAEIETCDLPHGTELALEQARTAIAKAEQL